MKTVYVITAMMAVFMLATGCANKDNKDAVTSANALKIGDILTAPGSYTNKSVTIEGKIVRECPSGCWFDLQEGGAIIHVDIKPSGLAIPQEVGKKAIVEGRVNVRDNNVEVIGTKVDIK